MRPEGAARHLGQSERELETLLQALICRVYPCVQRQIPFCPPLSAIVIIMAHSVAEWQTQRAKPGPYFATISAIWNEIEKEAEGYSRLLAIRRKFGQCKVWVGLRIIEVADN